ncbi:MAG: hypothetical protein ABF242_04780 [Flavobacteriales bacterium]
MIKKALLFTFLFPFVSFSGNDNFHIGARNSGMGNTGLTLADVWAIRYNQAALADVNQIAVGVSYESRFLTKSLGIQSFAVALPTKRGTFGLNYTGFGDNLYRETKVGLGYGMALSEKFNIGIRLNYHSLRLGNNYGNANSLTFEIGFVAKPIKNLEIGFHLFNPNAVKLNDYQNETIPVVVNLGVSYKFSEKLRTNVELEKDIDQTASFKVGLEYLPLEYLYIRAGFTTNPTMPTIGFGVVKKQFNIDFSAAFHPSLGITPALGMRYSF